ncbi:LytTr DNA-binding domain-containing protein [Tenacibaculum sp. MAR_2009_124]|uniref:LytR/AlgR family response regulator transcription factor n=1 Tax=Tenacibaculum sp. MAR_2009_124 TaxID=1250059 RepID=UPI00089999CE|nr:LytTR family DNA-binding domain-containing protein [Tenacibaculum sp. MAR_2009_124]SEB51985.1 LytTr DNA-binding domain-containing protein [Tenacibaculum sp. MAR_2009_124]
MNILLKDRNKTLELFKTNKLVLILFGVFVSIIALTIFQDFLISNRKNRPFNFSESLLFKTIWFLFIPIVSFLYYLLKKEAIIGYGKTILFIAVPVLLHLILIPVVSLIISIIFYDGRFAFYKFLSYSFGHDFYKLIIIYTLFVLGYRYWYPLMNRANNTEDNPIVKTIVVSNGKRNTLIKVQDIIQITASTPYVLIHLENKRYLHTETLKSLSFKLKKQVFFRVHKSTILNLSKIVSYKSRLNGDYDIKLNNGNTVRLSRTYSSEFKKAFRKK